MKVHLYDFRWLDGNTTEFQASVQNKLGKKQVQKGDVISLENCSTPKCAGSMNPEGIWSPCPEHAEGKAKCDLCKMRERNFIFTAFDGFDRSNVNESDLEKISRPHIVYLALFDTNIVKVGVSRLERKELRQLEQGAHFTLFIAETPDGITARQIETLFRKSGIADKVKVSQKRDFICPEITPEEGVSFLRKILGQHQQSLSEHEYLKKFLLKDPTFANWENQYALKKIQENPKGFHSIELKAGESVSGTIISMKGPFLILETAEELLSISTKDLLGREIDFSSKPIGLYLNNAFQSALF
ncbi:DUF2797 domain-containing protein [Candidatus Gracilibacteria bacterium]|nr:DUF2797 domain-containing protein [Candidatus Gracilibacteria bacterium]